MKTIIGTAAAIITLAGAGAARAQWTTPIQDWPARYTDGPFIFLLKADVEDLETGQNECLPAMQGLSDAASEEMERHQLARAETVEEARIFFVVEMAAGKTGNRCTVIMRPTTITEIQIEHAGSVSVGIGRAELSGMTGTKSDTDRMAQEAIRAFIVDTGRGILAARLRRALQAADSGR